MGGVRFDLNLEEFAALKIHHTEHIWGGRNDQRRIACKVGIDLKTRLGQELLLAQGDAGLLQLHVRVDAVFAGLQGEAHEGIQHL